MFVCVHIGQYVCLTLSNVSSDITHLINYSNNTVNGLLPIYSLLPNENKLSVLHYTVQRINNNSNNNIPIKSKQDMLFYVCI
jgi:hypothetical protein